MDGWGVDLLSNSGFYLFKNDIALVQPLLGKCVRIYLSSKNWPMKRLLKQLDSSTADSNIKEEQCRSLVKNINIGIFRSTADLDGRYIEINPAMKTMFGYDSTEDITLIRPLNLYQNPHDRELLLEELFQKGSVKNKELALRKKDGTFIWCSATATLKYKDNGEIGFIDGALEDITGRKLVENLMLGDEMERKRIACDLHDSIGQYLTALKYNAENILNQLIKRQADSSVLESLKKGIRLIQRTIEETRRIIMYLRPTILDDLGILAAISWFCGEFRNIYPNIQVKEEILLDEHNIPDALKIVIFRITQEAMNNAVKYSDTNRIKVRLRRAQDTIELSIIDNGKGFDTQNMRKGFGLISMRERAEGVGGVLSIQSFEGEGTIIQARWPSQKK